MFVASALSALNVDAGIDENGRPVQLNAEPTDKLIVYVVFRWQFPLPSDSLVNLAFLRRPPADSLRGPKRLLSCFPGIDLSRPMRKFVVWMWRASDVSCLMNRKRYMKASYPSSGNHCTYTHWTGSQVIESVLHKRTLPFLNLNTLLHCVVQV